MKVCEVALGRKLAGLAAAALIALSSGAGAVPAGEEQVKALVASRLGVRPASVSRTPFGLWEVSVLPDRVFYVDPSVRYLILGEAVDIETRENLTKARAERISRVDWKSLPKEDAIRVKHGSGRYRVAVFADATCVYCRLLESHFAKMQDVDVYTYVFPMKHSRPVAKNVVCAKDPGAAWTGLMVKGEKPAETSCDDSVLDRNSALAVRIGVAGTPTLVFPDGSRLGGVPSYDELVKELRKRNPGS